MNLSELLEYEIEDLHGKVVGFPTDTVFGIGARIDDQKAIAKIYELKQRDYHKPLAILAAKIEDIIKYIEVPDQKIKNIMEKYWPGPLTIIFKKKVNTDSGHLSEQATIAFRIPAEPIALKILDKFGPLATTSINLSGQEPLNDYRDIEKYFGNKIDFLITTNVKSTNFSSTIVDATNIPFKVIRQGPIKIE